MKHKSRITIVEHIYHSVEGKQPDYINHAWERELDSDEKKWQQEFTLTDQWIPVSEGCHLARVSMVHIHNEGIPTVPMIPTPEYAKELKAAQVEVGVDVGGNMVGLLLLFPGEHQRVNHSLCLPSLRMRSLSGSPKVTVTVYPK